MEITDSDTVESRENVKTSDAWLYCESCIYKCKKNKTMQKHISNQHENGEKCDKGVTNSETLEILEEHMTDQEKKS